MTTDSKALTRIDLGRVRVLLVRRKRALVEVRDDDGETHRVTYRRGQWTCAARSCAPCAHILAARLVVDLGDTA